MLASVALILDILIHIVFVINAGGCDDRHAVLGRNRNKAQTIVEKE